MDTTARVARLMPTRPSALTVAMSGCDWDTCVPVSNTSVLYRCLCSPCSSASSAFSDTMPEAVPWTSFHAVVLPSTPLDLLTTTDELAFANAESQGTPHVSLNHPELVAVSIATDR